MLVPQKMFCFSAGMWGAPLVFGIPRFWGPVLQLPASTVLQGLGESRKGPWEAAQWHKGEVEEGREAGWPQGREGCGQEELQEQNTSRGWEGNGYIDQGDVVVSSVSQDLAQGRAGEALELWLEEGKNGWRNCVRE